MNWRSAAVVIVGYLALSFLGTAAFGAAISMPSWLYSEPEPTRKPIPGVIDPKPSGVVYDAPEVPYTFVLPNGFAPRLKTARRDADLVPEPWLPTSAHIEIDREELTEDVSGMDAQRLREYAPTVLRGWTVKAPEEVFKTADGSAAFLYEVADPRSTHIAVLHRRIGVHLMATAHEPLKEGQSGVLRGAALTVARSMRFR